MDFFDCEISDSFAWVEDWHSSAWNYNRAEVILTGLKSLHEVEYQEIYDDDAVEKFCYPSDLDNYARGQEE